MPEKLTSSQLAQVEQQALALLHDKKLGNGARTAAKNFIHRAAKLRSYLVLAESEAAVSNQLDTF